MPAILQDFGAKIKGAARAVLADRALFTALLLVLVAAASFGLGRQSVREQTVKSKQAAAVVEAAPAVTPPAASSSRPMYVASKNGAAYHLLICPGAKQISEANKIYFKSKAEAEAAGYRPAGNCKGI